MCISSDPAHWSIPLLMAVPFALLLAGAAFLISERFIGRQRALWVALGVGVVAWMALSVLFVAFTGSLQRC